MYHVIEEYLAILVNALQNGQICWHDMSCVQQNKMFARKVTGFF